MATAKKSAGKDKVAPEGEATATEAAPLNPAKKYTRKKALVLPILKMNEESAVYIKIDAPMYVGKEQPGKDGKPADMEPATLMPVTEIETGELFMVIVNTALAGILRDTYPDDGYVGKSFEVIKHAKRPGKRYHNFSVFEIDA